MELKIKSIIFYLFTEVIWRLLLLEVRGNLYLYELKIIFEGSVGSSMMPTGLTISDVKQLYMDLYQSYNGPMLDVVINIGKQISIPCLKKTTSVTAINMKNVGMS